MVEEKEEPKEESAVEKAEKIAQRIEEANKKAEELLKKNEEITSRMILGGRSPVSVPQPPKEETPKEYAKRMLRGGK